MPPQKEDISQFYEEADTAYEFSNKHGILLSGGWGVGMDMANWLCGMENLMVLSVEQPDFVTDLIELNSSMEFKAHGGCAFNSGRCLFPPGLV